MVQCGVTMSAHSIHKVKKMSLTTRPGFNGFMKNMSEACTSLTAFSGAALETGLDHALLELIELRASQINGCAFCVQYHLSLAREAGLSQQKMDVLAVWHEAGNVYTAAEIAALTWAEHLTRLTELGAPDTAWTELQKHFTDEQIMSLTIAVVSINAWNRIALGLGFSLVTTA